MKKNVNHEWLPKWILSKIWFYLNDTAGEFAMIFGASLLGAVFGASIFGNIQDWRIQVFGGLSIFFIIFGYFTRKNKK